MSKQETRPVDLLKILDENYREKLQEEPEKELLYEDEEGPHYYTPCRFAIWHKATEMLRYVGEADEVVREWNMLYNSDEYHVTLDSKTMDFVTLPEDGSLEVRVAKDGKIKFLDGRVV